MRRLYILVLIAAVGALALTVIGTAGGKQGPKGPKTGKGQAAGAALFAQLSGRHEISASGKRGAGDLDGRGSFTALATDDTLCFGITVSGISAPTAAHVHKAKKKHNGPIVIPLTAPSSGDPGASSGCVSSDPDLLAAIRRHPQNYYANVHTTDFPGGAIRGQLFHAKPGQAR